MIGYIKRFGFWRGLRFYRVARLCDKNPKQLQGWALHYQNLASVAFRHHLNIDGRAYLGFAEILRSAHERIVLGRKPHQPILAHQQRRLDRALQRFGRDHQ
jgi:hypothetical protein